MLTVKEISIILLLSEVNKLWDEIPYIRDKNKIKNCIAHLFLTTRKPFRMHVILKHLLQLLKNIHSFLAPEKLHQILPLLQPNIFQLQISLNFYPMIPKILSTTILFH